MLVSTSTSFNLPEDLGLVFPDTSPENELTFEEILTAEEMSEVQKLEVRFLAAVHIGRGMNYLDRDIVPPGEEDDQTFHRRVVSQADLYGSIMNQIVVNQFIPGGWKRFKPHPQQRPGDLPVEATRLGVFLDPPSDPGPRETMEWLLRISEKILTEAEIQLEYLLGLEQCNEPRPAFQDRTDELSTISQIAKELHQYPFTARTVPARMAVVRLSDFLEDTRSIYIGPRLNQFCYDFLSTCWGEINETLLPSSSSVELAEWFTEVGTVLQAFDAKRMRAA